MYKLVLLYFFIRCSEIHADDGFGEIIDCAKSIINDGIEELNVPPFATIYIPEINTTLNHDMIEGQFHFSETFIKGISDFDMSLTMDGLEFKYQLQLYEVSFRTLYDINGRFFDMANMKGTGVMEFKFGMDYDGKVIIDVSSGIDFQIFPTIYPKFKITGLTIGARMSELLSKQINAIVDGIVNTNDFRYLFNLVIGTAVKMTLNGDIIIPDEIMDAIEKKCFTSNEDFGSLAALLQNRHNIKSDL